LISIVSTPNDRATDYIAEDEESDEDQEGKPYGESDVSDDSDDI